MEYAYPDWPMEISIGEDKKVRLFADESFSIAFHYDYKVDNEKYTRYYNFAESGNAELLQHELTITKNNGSAVYHNYDTDQTIVGFPGEEDSVKVEKKEDFGGLFGGSGGNNGEDAPGKPINWAEDLLPVKNPMVKNPIKEEGRVMLEMWIDREGKVVKVLVLKNHSLTTATNEVHFDTAEKAAWQWEFTKSKDRPEEVKVYKSINFTLN